MKKLLLSLLTVFACASAAFAGTTTILTNSSASTWEGDSTAYSTTIDGFKVTYTKGTSDAVAPKDDHIRVYKGATLSVKSTAGENITKIVLNTTGSSNTYDVDVNEVANSGVADKTAKTITWEGSAAEYSAVSTNGQIRVVSIEITTGEAAEVSAPIFSVKTGTYYVAQSVTITCTTPDIDGIYYTTDNSDPLTSSSRVLYSEPIAIDKTTTLKAVAFSGSEASEVTEATYTIEQPIACESVIDFLGLEANSVAKITCPLTVVYKKNSNLYVTDGTDMLFIYGSNISSKNLKNGDVISGGITGTHTPYYGNIEFVPMFAEEFGNATAGSEVEPTEMKTSEVTADHLNQYVIFYNVTVTPPESGKNFTIDGDAVAYNNFSLTFGDDFDTEATYDVVAIIGCHTANKTDGLDAVTADKLQIMPVSIESHLSSIETVDANAAKVVAGNGTISVLGNAKSIVVYNAAGAVVSANQNNVNCGSGLYIVKVDGKATKVIVK